jgi:plasmid stability protein
LTVSQVFWVSRFFQHNLTICEKRFECVQPYPLKALRAVAKGLIALVVVVIIGFSPVSVQAQITAQVSAKDQNGYGRIVFRFFKLPPYRVRISDGVLIMSFDDTINLSVDEFMKPLGAYFTAGRMDPSGKSIRFALSKKINLNTIVAGDRLFVDLLPVPWVGLPPSLPQKVIDELSAKSRMEEEQKRKLARREAFKNSKKILKVRVGRYPTFSRLVFDWTEKVGVKVARNGDTLKIQFDKLIRSDITRLKVDPPKFITGAKSKLTDNGLVVDVMLGMDTSIRAFREGLAYVVDVSGPLNEEEQKQRSEKTATLPAISDGITEPASPGERSEMVELEAEPSEQAPAIKAKKVASPVVPAATLPAAPVEKKSSPKPETQKPAMEKPPTETIKADVSSQEKSAEALVVKSPEGGQAKTPQMVVNKTSKRGGKSVATKAGASSAKDKKTKPAGARMQKVEQKIEKTKAAVIVKPSSAPVKKTKVVVSANAEKPVKTDNEKSLKLEVTLESGNVRLKFPFTQNVPAAVFQRGDSLWVVFDTRLKFDMSALGNGRTKYDRIKGYNLIRTKTSVAVLLQLDRASLATAAVDGTGWLVSVGDFIVAPVKPVTLVPDVGVEADSLARVVLNLKKPAGLQVYEDPKIGDRIAVVTTYGPPQGVVKSQRFVEFSTISTALGIAVQPQVDDLKIVVNSDNVEITRDEGLLLSSADGRRKIRPRRTVIDITRPDNIDFERWAQGGAAKFYNRRSELEREISSKSELKYTLTPRMELARLYVGNGLGAEALGTMEILKSINPKIENDPLFHALRGIANLMTHRLKAARFDLSSRGLSRDKDAMLWMGLLEADERNWVQARLNFSSGESAIRNYPDEIKALFRVKAARASIEANDISNARYQLAAMPKVNLERKFIAEAAFLNGRILELLTRNDEALDYYNEALSYGDRMVEAETSFFKTMLEFRLRYIKPGEALEQLESQLIAWRGDEVELKVMRELAKLYVARNSFRRGLETMRTAATYYPNAKISRLIQNDMVVLFNNLFLGEKIKALSPIKSLSLYYDFRELTPIGRLGDEMIRKLSDTLISVDLLDQAAEILTHQVEKRLKGAARAQVATKLAMVQLLRRQPNKALTIIRRTRQAVLPKRVARRRSLIEARALAELGRFELATSILANLEGKDVEQARAEALWQGKNWQNAGEAYERALGDVWKGAGKLSDTQKIDVLRAAISYTLAEDGLGNERLVTKFAEKMALSPDAQTFKVITSSNGGKETEFRNIAKKIASIDTLKGFLKEFRKADRPLFNGVESVPQS